MASTEEETTPGQNLSRTFRAAAGLSERKSDAPATNVENGDEGYEASTITNVTGPEGGYGGDEDRTMGLNQPYERRPSANPEAEVVEGPPNPPEGKAHNMSSGQWDASTREGQVVGESEGLSVSPIATDNPAEGVGEPPATPEQS